MTGNEQAAVRADAERRLTELRGVARSLWPDRSDPAVLHELLGILSDIRSAERAQLEVGRQP